jgi:hypothetical protein
MRMPATLGPRIDAKPARAKFGLVEVVSRKPPGPTTIRIAHEMANARE